MLRNALIFTCNVVPLIEIDPTYALDNSCYKTFFRIFRTQQRAISLQIQVDYDSFWSQNDANAHQSGSNRNEN